MPLTWKMLKEAKFDCEAAANCDRHGVQEVYEQTNSLSAGKCVRVETIHGQYNHTVAKSLDRLK